MDDFSYAGIDTCAADGLCETACPVGINTGEYIKHLRAESVKDETSALWIADHFAFAEKSIGFGVRLGHVAEKVIGVNGVTSVIKAAERLSNTTLPKWNQHIPSSTKKLGVLSVLRGKTDFIYFPSCISRQIGTPNDKRSSLAETFITVAKRAGINLHIPNDVIGHCCGMPFTSKGYKRAYQSMLQKTLMQMWEWSEHGKRPIVIDTTSCTHTLAPATIIYVKKIIRSGSN